MSVKPVIEVKNVTKNFKLPHEKTSSIKSGIVNVFRKRDKTVTTQRALKGISFDVKEGEFFGILGRNGSGKSTLLKILAEIYQPTKGRVDVKGKLVPFIELGVGFNPELTGRENVYLNGALLGFSTKEIDEKYDDIVEFAELKDFMDQKLKNYSSGMQVRLAFSVATRSEADILLVDEVLAVGDADFQRKCYDFFKSLKKFGKTVILVTHDMSAVRDYCDRAILINEGVIEHEGDADSTANEYLKLFNSSEEKVVVDDGSKRWGSGLVKIDKLKTQMIDGDIKITLDAKSYAEKKVEIIVGIRLIDSAGKLVAGVGSTRLLKGQHITVSPGKASRLTFTMPNIIGQGTYTVGSTILLSDKVTVCDDWPEASTVRNTKTDSYYPVILPAKLKTENL